MSAIFILNITTNLSQQRAELKLYDEHEKFLASHQVCLIDHPASLWEGLFDTHAHVERYANNLRLEGTEEPTTQSALLQRIGVFLGEKVLGEVIMAQLSKSRRHRTLLIRLPTTQDDLLAAAFARVPWEMARLKADNETLFERGLVVRATTANLPPAVDEEAEKPDGVVRVLLVLAEAPQSNPLAVRLERERLLELFEHEILPYRQVEIDFVCHGVTLETIEEQIRKCGGYDIVHWSGHGHYNALELLGKDGKPDRITGQELVKLFVEAGGFIPRLIFLSACHSGSFIHVSDWETLKAVLDNRLGTKEALQIDQKLREILERRKGYTGTALELLEAEVPQVVAMRYAVGDAYARRLARRFYQHLLADPKHHPTDTALALARAELVRDKRATEHPAIDHVTPILFGERQFSFKTGEGRSTQLESWQPQPQPLLAGCSDLEPPWGFVGRNQELTRLALEWLPRSRDKSPIAVIQGIAGLGKTALAAEAINLWHTRFKWVFAFQSRPMPITSATFYQRLDEKLTFVSTVYRETCKKTPNFRVYLSTQEYTGEQRYQHMRNNVLRALRAESILLVFDNFETNLDLMPDDSGYQCQDPEWERLLDAFNNTLKNSGSRLLMTTRHIPVVLKKKVLWIPLGPLPMSHQVQLFLQGHSSLRDLWYSGNIKEKDLLLRVFEVSRGHPLILQRLGNIATEPTSLEKVLTSIDTKGYQHLPDIFSQAENDQQREDERRYLEDVIQNAIDELIQRVSVNARRLLWIITLALESVPWFILDNVWETTWAGKDLLEQEPDSLQKLRELVAQLSLKPRQDVLPFFETPKLLMTEELLEKVPEITQEIRKQLEEEGYRIGVPRLEPLLKELIEAGLLQQEGEDEQAVYHCHELVRERCAAWVKAHPDEFEGFRESGDE